MRVNTTGGDCRTWFSSSSWMKCVDRKLKKKIFSRQELFLSFLFIRNLEAISFNETLRRIPSLSICIIIEKNHSLPARLSAKCRLGWVWPGQKWRTKTTPPPNQGLNSDDNHKEETDGMFAWVVSRADLDFVGQKAIFLFLFPSFFIFIFIFFSFIFFLLLLLCQPCQGLRRFFLLFLLLLLSFQCPDRSSCLPPSFLFFLLADPLSIPQLKRRQVLSAGLQPPLAGPVGARLSLPPGTLQDPRHPAQDPPVPLASHREWASQ